MLSHSGVGHYVKPVIDLYEVHTTKIRINGVSVMNGVLVSTLVRLGFSGTALKPPIIFMYLSLQQFILSNLVLVPRPP